jgi:ComF family protein
MRGFDRAHALGFYEGKLRKLIHVFKYAGVPTLARPLAQRLVTAIPADTQVDLIVPVPMHWWRRYRRGYNQAQLLARELAGRIGVPCENAARRCLRTPPQASLSHRERSRSLKDAFTIRRPDSVRGRHVLLVDDVFTTGATASGCGAVLKRAGAASVTVLTLARVDRRTAVPESRM